MQKIRLASIHEGQRFEQDLYLPSGQKLLAAGAVVTESQRAILAGLPDPFIFEAATLDELVDAGLVDKPKDYRPSTPARRSYLSDAEMDEAAKRKTHVASAESQVNELIDQARELDLRVQPLPQSIWEGHTPSANIWPDVRGIEQRKSALASRVADAMARLVDGKPVPIAELEQLVDPLYRDLLDFRQRFTQLALLCQRRENYLPGHAVCVAALAMATAGQLRWPQRDVKRIGVLGLVFDAGMMLVPERIRVGGCALSELDRNKVHRHPSYSVSLLRLVEGLDPLMRLAAYQHHERENGMGYPRATRGEALCDYAKVLGIVDVFAAATGPRAWTKPKLPYTIMEEIIRAAASGVFCRVTVRALVQAAGLFPVGSYVLMSNDRIAHVLAANPKQLDRPLIQLLGDDGQPTGDPPIDLAQVPSEKLSVVKPAPQPQAPPVAA